MKFRSVSVTNFRNLDTAQIELNPRVNVFIGQNGQGKTNFLEAVYFLSHGKSFRPSNKETLISKRILENQFALIKGIFNNEIFETSIESHLTYSKRSLLLGGKASQPASIMKHVPLVLFSPESLAAIKEGPEIRRELIDELVVISRHENADLLSDYSKALRSRNRLLKQRLNGELSENDFQGTLDSLNDVFFKLAAKVTKARTDAIRAILTRLQTTVREIMGQAETEIDVRYLISDQDATQYSEEESHLLMVKRSQELLRAEMETGHSLVGPHKHDISVLFNGMDSRFYCSQGQQRALILSFKIAQIMHHKETYGSFPVLLLDDVLSELDEEKRFFLVQFLKEIDTQTLVTSTEISHFNQGFLGDNSGVISVFEVAEGKFKLLSP